jgi:membrane-associated phospholipid phosphatase
LFLITGAGLIASMERGREILYFDSLHTPFFDTFFRYVTHIAEAPLLLFSLVVALRFSYGKGIILALNSCLVFAVTSALKHLVFDDQDRPSIFFAGKATLHFVPGLEILQHNSFPSGHTAGAFGLFFMLSVLIHDKRWSVLCFALPLLVGISRVYLLQHFFRDVYAGSLVGVGVGTLFYFVFVRSGFYNNLTWKDKALLKK